MTSEKKYEPIDEHADQPVTTAEFNIAMRWIAESFSKTADDLQQLATKDDLNRLATRFETTFASAEENRTMLDDWGRQLFAKIDAAVENRFLDLGAARREEVEAIKDEQQKHAERIASLEDRRPLSPTG